MGDDYQELKDRLVKLSDEQLIDIVTAAPGEYRQDALEIAKTELKWRKVEIPDSDEDVEVVDAAGPYDPSALGAIQSARQAASRNECVFCGGPLRAGTLVAEKELTVIFADNQEDRFVKVNACTQCGHISLVVDFETDVKS
jgi:hypothetical protein